MTKALACILVVLCSRAVAWADVPDSAWEVVKDRPVVVTLTTGGEVRGRPIAVDEDFVTLIEDGSGRVIPIARMQVATLHIPAAPAPAPPVERHVGLQLYTGPGNIMVDFDIRHFYGFVGGSVGYPIIFSGTSNRYGGGVVAAGAQWRLSPTSNWKFDLTATLLPTWWSGFSVGIGVSAGFHWTSPSGLTVGFKIPVFGLAPGYSGVTGDFTASDKYKPISNGSSLIANYYLEASMALPMASLGYRFK